MVLVLFPDQLFLDVLEAGATVYLVEHPLFFTQLRFHKQKLIFHHVSVRSFRDLAIARGCACEVVPLETLEHTTLLSFLLASNCRDVTFIEPRDDYLEREISAIAKQMNAVVRPSPAFLTPVRAWAVWSQNKKTLRMHQFYQWQRQRLGILMDGALPSGGKWSFDTENRKALPRSITAPTPFRPSYSEQDVRSIREATDRFADWPGSEDFHYPVSHSQATAALEYFLKEKLHDFGDYEDAVSRTDPVLFHSQLSPLINSGLLTPRQVLSRVLTYADENTVPLNSLEGFIRQLIGWREFMGLAYHTHGRYMRTCNTLQHHNPLPSCFWEGKTGLLPVDHVVQAVLKTGYAHHIERLMILGVFLLLTETEPTEAFHWFFAMFIDAYDWVMVPNVYGMSQYADGGLLTTKPYLCGSAYLRKMTDFPPGPWCPIWDALYWRWVSRHQPLLQKNLRTSMSVAMWRKFSAEKQQGLLSTAQVFLDSYHAPSPV